MVSSAGCIHPLAQSQADLALLDLGVGGQVRECVTHCQRRKWQKRNHATTAKIRFCVEA